ncbi:MAG: hypothetical protein M1343_10420 [Chloroflexi bacterium]|nr:hypothetical protein [Chloroflexota bacterium]
MSRRDAGALYNTWNESWRPRVNRRQGWLVWGLAGIVLIAVTLHWLAVLSPQMAVSFAGLERPYQPWYLSDRPPAVTRAVASPPLAKTAGENTSRPTAVSREFLAVRPNLVPLSEDWNAGELQRAVLLQLSQEVQDRRANPHPPNPEASAVAQQLAERYAVDGPEAVQGEYETSLLSGGWLWEVRRGCEASVYTSFPDSSIEQLGCGIQPPAEMETYGLGVARGRGPDGQQVPVFALVWRAGGGGGKK